MHTLYQFNAKNQLATQNLITRKQEKIRERDFLEMLQVFCSKIQPQAHQDLEELRSPLFLLATLSMLDGLLFPFCLTIFTSSSEESPSSSGLCELLWP